MNGRDWREIFIHPFEDMKAGQRLAFSATARSFKLVVQSLGWLTMYTGTGDMDWHMTTLTVGLCHAWDVLSRHMHGSDKHRLQFRSHARILMRHFGQHAHDTLTPFLTDDEGLFEKALKESDKRFLQRAGPLTVSRSGRALATVSALHSQNAANRVVLGAQTRKKDKTRRPTFGRIMFMPCTLADTGDVSALRWRLVHQVAGRPGESLWGLHRTYAGNKGQAAISCRVLDNKEGETLTVCVCASSLHGDGHCTWSRTTFSKFNGPIMTIVSTLSDWPTRTTVHPYV